MKSVSEIENNKSSEILNLHSGAIHVENKLSLKAKLCWFNMVYKAIPSMKAQDIFTVTIGELKKAIDYRGTDNQNFKKVLEELRDTKIEWNIFEKNEPSWGWDHLLSGCRVRLNSNIIEYSFSPFLKEKLTNPEMYAKINLLISRNFKSKHSLAIYCLALDYLQVKSNYGEKVLSIEQIRKYLGLEENELKKPGDLNIWVIKKAVSDINKNSDMKISIEVKRGERNKIIAFKLKMSLKKEHLDFYKPKKVTGQVLEIQQTELFNLEPNLLEASKNKNENKPKPKKKELIKINSSELKSFYALHKISMSTDTVQNKLKEIREMFHDKLENYLLFLMNYAEQEANKKTITSFSGFYIGLLKDDSQIENYLCHFQEQKTKEEDKKTRIKALIEPELQKKYEKYILSDFEKYLEKNITKLEAEIIKLIKSTIKGGDFLYDVVITRGNKGIIDGSLVTASKPMYKNLIISHLNTYSKDLDYEGISFAEWKEQELTEKYLEELEAEIEKSL